MSDLTLSLRIRANADGTATIINGVGDSVRGLGNNANNSTRQLNEMQSGVDRLSQRLANMGHMAAKTFLASWGVAQTREIVMLADKMTLLDSRINISTSSIEDYKAVNKALVDVSLKTGSSLESNVQLFARINKSIESMGGSAADTVGLTKTLAEGLKISGASAGEASSVMVQLSQALSSGVLRGDEFNSIMENGSRVVDALSAATGKSRGELRKMAEAGELSSQLVVSALQSQAKAVEEDYKKIPLTVGAAMANVKTQFAVYIKAQNEARGATSSLAETIDSAGKNISAVIGGVTLAAQGLFAFYMTKLIPSAIAYIATQRASMQASRQASLVSNAHAQAITYDLERTVTLTTARVSQTQADLAAARATQQNTIATTSGFAGMTARLAATRAVTIAEEANALATRNLTIAEQARAAAIPTLTARLGALFTAQNLVNGAMMAFMGYQIGTQIGEWANGFEIVRKSAIDTFSAFENGVNQLFLAKAKVALFFGGSVEEFAKAREAFDKEKAAIQARVDSSHDYVAGKKPATATTTAAEDPTLKDFYAKQKQMDTDAAQSKADSAKKVLDDRKAKMDDAVSYVKLAADKETALIDDQINQLDSLYKNGEVSVKQYFDRSAELIKQNGSVAMGAIKQQLDLVNSELATLETSAPTVNVQFDTKGLTGAAAQFAEKYGAAAEKAAQALGTKASFILAQIAEETGYGRSIVPGTNNLGNIKLTNAERKAGVPGVPTTDNANGTKYLTKVFTSVDEYFKGFVKLMENPRYNGVKGAQSIGEYAGALKAGGYAENPITSKT